MIAAWQFQASLHPSMSVRSIYTTWRNVTAHISEGVFSLQQVSDEARVVCLYRVVKNRSF